MRKLAIITTGSRDWFDRVPIYQVLGDIRPRIVIHGRNPRGVDAIVDDWCKKTTYHVICEGMRAYWDEGKSAGPRRNMRMLQRLLELKMVDGYEIAVHAWPLPSSRGTVHMMRIAEKAGVSVIDHGYIRRISPDIPPMSKSVEIKSRQLELGLKVIPGGKR